MRIILCLLCVSFGWGEVVEWRQNQPIDCPMEVSEARQVHRPRLIYFPSKKITFHRDWDKNDLEITSDASGSNVIQVMLKNPKFNTPVFILGVGDGAVYPLHIRPIGAEEQAPDPVMQVTRAARTPESGGAVGAPAGGGTGHAQTVDEEALALMRHMFGWDKLDYVKEQADGRYDDKGTFLPGRVLQQSSDAFSLVSMRMYRGVHVMGYQMILTYRGEQPHRINLQQLRMMKQRSIAVHIDGMVIGDRKNPHTDLAPGSRRVLYFISEIGGRR